MKIIVLTFMIFHISFLFAEKDFTPMYESNWYGESPEVISLDERKEELFFTNNMTLNKDLLILSADDEEDPEGGEGGGTGEGGFVGEDLPISDDLLFYFLLMSLIYCSLKIKIRLQKNIQYKVFSDLER